MSDYIAEIGAAAKLVMCELADRGEAKWYRQYMTREVAGDIADRTNATVFEHEEFWIFRPKLQPAAKPQSEASTVVADFERNCNLARKAGETGAKGIESTLSEHISKYEDCARQSAVHAAMADHAKKELVRAFESLMNVINEDYKKHMENK